MTDPKRQHFVPAFYLRRFADADGRVHVFDKSTGAIFATSPKGVGAEKHFYRFGTDFRTDADPNDLERELAFIEGHAADIFALISEQLRSGQVELSDDDRECFSFYIATQMLRTPETREQLRQFRERLADMQILQNAKCEESENKYQHLALLWSDGLVTRIRDWIANSIWIYGRNNSSCPFITSDHPAIVKSHDSRQWLSGPRIFDPGAYLVYPLSPEWLLYCKDPSKWNALKQFADTISPVEFTEDMAKHENSGQVGMSWRFVFAAGSDFSFIQEFAQMYPEILDPRRSRFGV